MSFCSNLNWITHSFAPLVVFAILFWVIFVLTSFHQNQHRVFSWGMRLITVVTFVMTLLLIEPTCLAMSCFMKLFFPSQNPLILKQLL